METRIVNWNGTEIPEGFRDLPPGQYCVESVNDPFALTPEEDAGIREALDEAKQGLVRDAHDVYAEIRERLRQR